MLRALIEKALALRLAVLCLAALLAGIGGHRPEILEGDVAGLGAGGEFPEADIDGVGARFDGGKKRFETAGRSEKLGKGNG